MPFGVRIYFPKIHCQSIFKYENVFDYATNLFRITPTLYIHS